MKTRIGVIFGGRSGEHEVSIRSAQTVIREADRNKYSIVPIAIKKTGEWLNPKQSAELLNDETQALVFDEISKFSDVRLGMLADTKGKGLIDLTGGGSDIRLDVLLPVLHGTYGEDGTIQGLFEMADIPYVGCGVLASSCGMDKVAMKALFREAGLPICKYTWFLRSEWESKSDAVMNRIESEIGYPCFVKPANLGSSVGVSRADDGLSFRTAVESAAEFDRKIIVEEAVKMREIECAILGNDTPEASRPGEYIIRDKETTFLDYTEKYGGTGNNEFVVPAPVSEELSSKIREMAIGAFKAIDGAGLARVDFFLRTDYGTLLVNEINTMPGLTDSSGFPKMWAGSGKPFAEVIDELVRFAIERHKDRSRNKTSVNI